MHLPAPTKKDQISSSPVQNTIRIVLVLNLLVLGIKIFIGTSTKSLSILGDAVHSGVDSLNNIIGLTLVSIAAAPPDKEHPYGHAKFETLGALGIVAFLAVASFELIEKSIMRFINPAELPILDMTAILLLAGTLIINIFVWLYERHMGEKYNSEFLLADAEHTFSDVLITTSILISVYFILQGYYILDPILGIVVALIILRSGWEILRRTVPILVDEAWVDPADIEEIVLNVDKASACMNVKSRKGQLKSYIEMTVQFETDSLALAHRLSHVIEHQIQERFGDCEVTIHIEPSKTELLESHD